MVMSAEIAGIVIRHLQALCRKGARLFPYKPGKDLCIVKRFKPASQPAIVFSERVQGVRIKGNHLPYAFLAESLDRSLRQFIEEPDLAQNFHLVAVAGLFRAQDTERNAQPREQAGHGSSHTAAQLVIRSHAAHVKQILLIGERLNVDTLHPFSPILLRKPVGVPVD